MQDSGESKVCFPHFNSSCRKKLRSPVEALLTSSLLFCITLLTVTLNLLVIISIYHFRQLHTTTNLLLLSLAVADFLVGFLQMPVEILLLNGCWILGDIVCLIHNFLAMVIVNASVGNMVLISVDRYVAICEPMLYSTKVTMKRVQLCICLCWIFSTVHTSWMIRDLLAQPGKHNSCYGECVLMISHEEGIVDFFVTFFGPITVIVVLYSRVFGVAVSHSRPARLQTLTVIQRSKKTPPLRSQVKAAKTLGVVVVIFLLCFCPLFVFTVAESNMIGESSTAEVWLLYLNSCLNPLIYVFCYPWFRKSIKRLVTLQPVKACSFQVDIM
ncbi:trace amine-associated receptor 1-like [Nelusetta ayraudi]|uniref:trace amine-associated receptor 1-like n=1 Tax=Nelusetta ayraudi TaxID=303726 RepID=UPI003F6F5D72